MPSSYTSNLRLTLPLTGENSGTWGDLVNTGITALLDASIAGTASVTMTAADKTLSANNGATDEARRMFVALTGTPGASFNVVVPTSSKLYFVKNGTGFAQTVKTVAGTGISVPDGTIMALYCDGTNVVEASTAPPSGAKTTPVDTDSVVLSDSAASSVLKKLTWANLKAAIKTYLSGVSFPIGSTTPAAGGFTTLSVTGATTLGSATPAGIGAGEMGLPNSAALRWRNAANSAYLNAMYVNSSNKLIFGGSAVSGIELSVAGVGTVATLDSNGNLLVGAVSGTYHNVQKAATVGTGVLLVGSSSAGALSTLFLACDAAGYNAAPAASWVCKNSSNNRSINAGGTINASGADYAEYERNNGLTISKGSIVGFKSDGTLTNVFVDAIRFALKSTNPSYVGGDTWGSEDQVGKRPDEPQRIADKTEQQLVSAAIPAVAEVKDEDGEVITEAMPAVEAVYGTIITEAGDTDAEWAIKQADYATAKAAFEAALEAARQQVDRIAYSGKVPCNVVGAVPGDYIVAVDSNGSIAGEFVADPDFAQYKKAVGRVNRILPDGRCEVAVIIH